MVRWIPIRSIVLAACTFFVIAAQANGQVSSAPDRRADTVRPDQKPYDGHPRLFFDGPAEKNGLLRNLSPAKAAIWQGVLKATSPNVEARSGRAFGHNLAATALVYGISGDKAYFEGARAGLLRGISDEELWGGERLNRAEMLYGIAVAYDCLFNDLSDNQRTRIRQRLVAELPLALRGSWTRRPISNQTWVSCAALACAAYAVRGEDPAAEEWTKYAVRKLKEHVMLRATDGTPSNEGLQYGAYEGIWGLIHRFVVERGEYPNPQAIADDDASAFAANYGRFWLHASVPGHRSWVDYGDSHTRKERGHAVSQALAWYSALYQHQGRALDAGATEWLRQQRLAQHGDFEHWTAFHFLWHQDGIEPISPRGKVPRYGHFRDYEYHIFRDDWEDPNSSWFAFKCSPQPSHTFWMVDPTGQRWESTGHGHPDTGHFSLVSEGQWLAADDGYTIPASINHNTLVLDNDLQLGEQPGIKFGYRPEKFPALAKVDVFGEVDSDAGHFLTGDMTAAYPNAQLVHRHIVVLPGPMRIVIADECSPLAPRVDSASQSASPTEKPAAHNLHWLLHPAEGTLTQEGPQQLLVQVGPSSMRVQIAHPPMTQISVGAGNSNRQKITLTAAAAQSPFVVALLPGKAAAQPAEIGAGGELRFATGETVKWNFDKPNVPLCVVEGPNGLVLARATSYESDWIKLQSTQPIYLSLDKSGQGTLASPPGSQTATVRITLQGQQQEYRIAPDSYVEVGAP
jgi:hypothetical protein